MNIDKVIRRNEPITVVARSMARDVLACSDSRIVDSNEIRGMDVCAHFCVFVLSCVGSDLAVD
jgi:hypothetical protein